MAVPTSLQAIVNWDAMWCSQALSHINCHHNTRNNYRRRIINWFKEGCGEILLLRGPIGVGKTALCSSIAQEFEDTLCGGTYFIQPNSNPEDDLLKMPATLAMGLSRNFQQYGKIAKRYLSNVGSDYYLGGSSRERWRVSLLLPLRDAIQECGSRPEKRYLMIIDGIDAWECKKRWIELFGCIRMFCEDAQLPLAWIISFRSSVPIKGILMKHEINSFISSNEIVLANDDEAATDIQHYVDYHLNAVTYETYAPPSGSRDQSIFSDKSLRDLMDRANGQFAFVDDSIEFIANPFRNPDEQYQVLCTDESIQVVAYERLDRLYYSAVQSAMQGSSDATLLRRILHHLIYKEPAGSSIQAIAESCGFSPRDLHVAVLPLVGSIIACNFPLKDTDILQFYHPSFKEYITTQGRSREQFIEEHLHPMENEEQASDFSPDFAGESVSVHVAPEPTPITERVAARLPRIGIAAWMLVVKSFKILSFNVQRSTFNLHVKGNHGMRTIDDKHDQRGTVLLPSNRSYPTETLTAMWVPAEGRFEALKPYVTIPALHFAAEEGEPLHYNAGSRATLLHQIDTWAQDLSSPSILCLTGPIGTGKTVMVKEAVGPIWRRAHLAGEFFFWRGNPARSGLATFATTLAYHLGFILPSAAKVIRATLDDNPSILQAPPEEQWESLIIRPLQTLEGETISFRPLFVIDGVDECPSQDDQLWVVLKMVELCSRFPVALLLSSRPEYHLKVAFSACRRKYPSLFGPIIELKNDDNTRQDLRELLRPISHYVNGTEFDRNWTRSIPLDETFEGLITDACGQFIFVDGIRDYLDRDDISYDGFPEQMKQLRHNGLLQSQAFTSLDKRYDDLMTAANSYLTDEQKIIRDRIFYYLLYIQLDSIHAISIFWEKSPAAIHTVLQQYHSVIHVPTSNHRPLSFITYSFQGFLSSPHRGGDDAKHYISKSSLVVDAFERSLYLAEHHGIQQTSRAPAYLFSLWLKLGAQIDLLPNSTNREAQNRVIRLLSDFNFLAWVSQWYRQNRSDDLDNSYQEFRGWLARISQSTVSKFREDALLRSESYSPGGAGVGLLVQFLKALLPEWVMDGITNR
ncbi:hypothetical protein AX16_004131 [Volvariella volvacea WC 439]|nr:hypothetical protein AX16_004131 [Volvariella volvacea WC 439]